MKNVIALLLAAQVASAAPIADRARRAKLAEALAKAHPSGTLTKEQLRPVIKAFIPLIAPCLNDAGKGVANLKLAFESAPKLGTIVTVTGFDPDSLAPEAGACIRETTASLVLYAVGDGGHADLLYPFSFAPTPPDNHDTSDFDRANRAFAADHWSEALAAAERGLTLTSLDGLHRRPLIRIAGIAACHLGDTDRSAHYEALASSENAAAIRGACKR